MTKMKIEQIHQVLTINQCGSINKAAEALFLSQPNLSISLKNLEDELGYKIFLRSNHGVKLTEQGKVFVQAATAVMGNFENLVRLGKPSQKENGRKELSIAIMPYRYLSSAAVRLYENYCNSDLNLTFHSGSRDDIVKSVYSGESEIGILSVYSPYFDLAMMELTKKRIHFMQLGEVPISILVGKQSPFYNLKEKTISKELLAGKCFVALKEMEYGTLSSLPDILGLGRERCPQKIYTSSWSLMIDIVRQIDCFSIVGTNTKAYEVIPYYQDVRTFRLEDCPYTSKIGWICREGFGLSALSMEYLNLIYPYFE